MDTQLSAYSDLFLSAMSDQDLVNKFVKVNTIIAASRNIRPF